MDRPAMFLCRKIQHYTYINYPQEIYKYNVVLIRTLTSYYFKLKL